MNIKYILKNNIKHLYNVYKQWKIVESCDQIHLVESCDQISCCVLNSKF